MKRGLLARLLLGLLVSLGLLGGVELVLRLVGYRYQPAQIPVVTFTRQIDAQIRAEDSFFRLSKELLWEHTPGKAFTGTAGDVVNVQGFRGPPLPPAGQDDALRVVCLGDSSTFGAHVEADETFSAQLQQQLGAAGRPAHVLNAGVIGYSSMQSCLLLEQQLLALQPDVVVLYLGAINDGRPAKPHSDREKLALRQQGASLGARLREASQSLRLGQLLRRYLNPAPSLQEQMARQGVKLLNPESARTGDYTMRVPLDEFRANLRRAVRLSQEAGARPLLVIPSRREAMEQENVYQVRYSDALAELAEELGVTCLDARAAVRAAPGGTDAHHVADSRVHPNPAGHALIAGLLAEAILAGD